MDFLKSASSGYSRGLGPELFVPFPERGYILIMNKPNGHKVLSTEEIYTAGIFRLRSDQLELPSGKIMPNYYVMEFTDWVHVVPITHDDQIILVEQYRHAVGRTTLEFPGGAISHGTNEGAELAGLRELREETGYVPLDVRYLGKQSPNPAIQNNWLHTYIALGCSLEGPQQLDPYEDIKVILKPIREVIDMAFDGQIEHSLMLSSLFRSLKFLGYSF